MKWTQTYRINVAVGTKARDPVRKYEIFWLENPNVSLNKGLVRVSNTITPESIIYAARSRYTTTYKWLVKGL